MITASSQGPAPRGNDRPQQRQAEVGRRYPVVMLAAAATIGTASYLHLDGRIPLGFTTITGEHFSHVSIPEAIIGAVLAAGAVTVTVAPRRARTVARGVIGFAVLGVLAGLGITLASSPHLAADLAYHLGVLTVLLAALMALVWPGRSGQRGFAGRLR